MICPFSGCYNDATLSPKKYKKSSFTYRQMLERSDTLCERRGRGVDPVYVGDSIDLSLENARVDSLSNGDPNSATHSPKL